MSFLSVLHDIGSIFGKITPIVTSLEPVIGAIPVYGTAFNTIFNSIVTIEGLFAGVLQAGTTKKAVVTTIVNATITTAQAVPAAVLSAAIDEIVAALNTLQVAQGKVTG
jgi:hypothetical protein